MSIVNTETLQADKLVAKDGKDETEVSIPSLSGKVCFFSLMFGASNSGVTIRKSFNISSVQRASYGSFSCSFINNPPDADYVVVGDAAGGTYILSTGDNHYTNGFTFLTYNITTNNQNPVDRSTTGLVGFIQ